MSGGDGVPKVTEAHMEARRQQVLEAAAACFARNGFHQTSIDDICREAGLSAGAVYRYFRGKEEIIRAISEAGHQRNLALIQAAQQTGSTEEIMGRLADAFFPLAGDPSAQTELCMNVHFWSEAMRDPQIRALFLERMASVRAAFTAMTTRAQQRGEIDPALDPESIARVMMAMYSGLILRAALGTGPDVPRYIAAAKAMASGLFRQPAKRPATRPVRRPSPPRRAYRRRAALRHRQ